MSIDYGLIGKRIKTYRKNRKMTQENLAELLDVSVGYVSQIERGATKINLDTLSNISYHLHCDITNLLSNSVLNSSSYLNDEFSSALSLLDDKQKKLLLDIIYDLLKYNI